jgi:putative tricarboxylic transport membrane protein
LSSVTQARGAGIVALAVGVVAGLEVRNLGVGSLTDPGPGLWPLIVSVVLVLTGAAVAVWPGDGADVEVIGREAGVVVVACLSLVAYTAVISTVGFELPTVLLIAFWLRFLGSEPWLTTAAVSLGVTAVVYVVFIVALGVALPHLA